MKSILHEARVRFTKQQLEQAAADDEHHLVFLTMLTNGDIVIGYELDIDKPLANPRRGAMLMTVLLTPEKKEIELRSGSHGEHLMPRAQQSIRALRDAGIIDPTWTIRTRMAFGYYPRDSYEYKKLPEPIDQKNLEQLADKALRLTPLARDLVFYHGTTESEWQRIKKVGLHPLFVGSNQQYGFDSRGKHEGNANVLYLASTMTKAFDYARERARSNNARVRGNSYVRGMQNDPVILRVQIPDPARLMADDDLIIRLMQRISRRLWRMKPVEVRQRITDEINQQKRLTIDRDTAEMLWRETAEGFAEIMQRLPKRAFGLWLASLKHNDQVGYRGIIPPKFIMLVLTGTQA